MRSMIKMVGNDNFYFYFQRKKVAQVGPLAFRAICSTARPSLTMIGQLEL